MDSYCVSPELLCVPLSYGLTELLFQSRRRLRQSHSLFTLSLVRSRRHVLATILFTSSRSHSCSVHDIVAMAPFSPMTPYCEPLTPLVPLPYIRCLVQQRMLDKFPHSIASCSTSNVSNGTRPSTLSVLPLFTYFLFPILTRRHTS